MITTICYGDERKWNNRADALAFFFAGMRESDGCEKQRYTKIYEELEMGFDYCTDDPDLFGAKSIRELMEVTA